MNSIESQTPSRADKINLALLQAMTLILTDWPTHPIDAVFFHGLASGNDDNDIFNVAASLYLYQRATYVAINGSEGERFGGVIPGEAWAGYTVWRQRLILAGISANWILPTEPAFNTKEDCEAFLKLARERKWTSAAVLTQPHQMLRTMLSWVKTMQDASYMMRLHPVTQRPMNWNKRSFGSQAAVEESRFAQITKEFERIPVYQKKGDLATLEELVAYLTSEICA